MRSPFSISLLRKQNRVFNGTGGVSQVNRTQGFIPAFYDTQSHEAQISRFANGTPAPIHMLDGLPTEWVVKRDPSGRVTAVKGTVVAGFLSGGKFYTREQAALMVNTAF
jgi:hypothetical protein